MLQKLCFEPLKEIEEKLYYYVLGIFWCRQGTDFHNHGSDVGTTVLCDDSVISDIAILYQG